MLFLRSAIFCCSGWHFAGKGVDGPCKAMLPYRLSTRPRPQSMSVYTKLMTARITLQSMEIKKSGENKFAKYYYFELGDFLPAVQKIFYDLGLCGVVSYHEDRAILAIYDCENPTEVTHVS